MQIAIPEYPKPEEKRIVVRLASFGFKIATGEDVVHSQVELEAVKEQIIKPIFVRASKVLKAEFRKDDLEYKISSVENGSFVVEAGIFISFLAGSGITLGVAQGVLTNIITNNIYSVDEKKQYDLLLNKLRVITKTYALETEVEFKDKKRTRVFINQPNSDDIEVKEYFFDPEVYDEAKSAVDEAVRNYHGNIKKP